MSKMRQFSDYADSFLLHFRKNLELRRFDQISWFGSPPMELIPGLPGLVFLFMGVGKSEKALVPKMEVCHLNLKTIKVQSYLPIVWPVVSLHDQLMSPRNQSESVGVVKLNSSAFINVHRVVKNAQLDSSESISRRPLW